MLEGDVGVEKSSPIFAQRNRVDGVLFSGIRNTSYSSSTWGGEGSDDESHRVAKVYPK